MTTLLCERGALRGAAGQAPPREPSPRDADLVALVCAARSGDQAAWERLIRRFEPMLRGIARSYRLSRADIDDVAQATWLDLLTNIDDLREPAAIAGWLATTVRRRAMRVLQVPVRERLTGDPELGERPDTDELDGRLLAVERRRALARALASLPERHRQLMIVLLTRPELNYGEISDLLSMPQGSIGPIRARSLARLARHTAVREFRGEVTPSPMADMRS